MDNASIHYGEELLEAAEAAGARIIFNVPNSPELNPIEMIFGIWKSRAEDEIRVYPGIKPLLRVLASKFETLGHRDVCRCVAKVWTTIYSKVLNREDI